MIADVRILSEGDENSPEEMYTTIAPRIVVNLGAPSVGLFAVAARLASAIRPQGTD